MTKGRHVRKVLIATLLVLSASLVVVPFARAVEPLPYASLSPPNGQVYAAQAQTGISWMLTGGPSAAIYVTVSVSRSNAVGSDGVTLSDLSQVDSFILGQSSTDVGVFRGVSHAGPSAWPNFAGTYYWQVQARWTEFPPYPALPTYHYAVSPIFAINIQAPPPPVQPTPTPPPTVTTTPTPPQRRAPSMIMVASDARYYVRTMIREQTGRTPRGLKYGCARLTTRSFRCRPSWYDRRYVYAGTATFRHFLEGRELYASATFTGLRATPSCAKRRSVKSCARRVRWREPAMFSAP
jgi:hypothetical protein